MATYTVTLLSPWDATNLTTPGPAGAFPRTGDEFRLKSDWSNSTDARTMTVTDDDTKLNGDPCESNVEDNSQQTATVTDASGSPIACGYAIAEYAFEMLGPGNTIVTVHSIYVDNTLVGYAADAPIQPGANYKVVDAYQPNGTAAPSYSSFDALAYEQGPNNTITGTDREDSLEGGTGDDSITALGGNDTLGGGSGNDTLDGGSGDDSLSGGTGADHMSGGDGSDTFVIRDGFGNDTIVGGEGGTNRDTIDLSDMTAPVTVTYTGDKAGTITYTGDKAGTITDGTSTLTFSEIEHLILTDYADVVQGELDTAGIEIDGRGGNDSISGGLGADILAGGSGNDTLDGGAGNDTLTGGSGNDNITTGTGDDVVLIDQSMGSTTVTDFDIGDADSDGKSNDQLDVSDLRDLEGNPVNIWDVVVSDDGSGNALLTFPEGETLTLQGITPAQMTGQQMVASGIPCYAPATMIDTPSGPRAVETLRPGDLVTTLDHGPQPIRWTRSGLHPLERTEADDKPVLICAGALGQGLPAQDLIVSPQHRMFVGGHGQLQDTFGTEAFAPAKSLTGLRGIRHMMGKKSITWIHFACDHHEIVRANGCLSESLLLGPMVVNGLCEAERKALMKIYGPACTYGGALNGPPARACLRVGEVLGHLTKCKNDTKRHAKKDRQEWNRDLAMEG